LAAARHAVRTKLVASALIDLSTSSPVILQELHRVLASGIHSRCHHHDSLLLACGYCRRGGLLHPPAVRPHVTDIALQGLSDMMQQNSTDGDGDGDAPSLSESSDADSTCSLENAFSKLTLFVDLDTTCSEISENSVVSSGLDDDLSWYDLEEPVSVLPDCTIKAVHNTVGPGSVVVCMQALVEGAAPLCSIAPALLAILLEHLQQKGLVKVRKLLQPMSLELGKLPDRPFGVWAGATRQRQARKDVTAWSEEIDRVVQSPSNAGQKLSFEDLVAEVGASPGSPSFKMAFEKARSSGYVENRRAYTKRAKSAPASSPGKLQVEKDENDNEGKSAQAWKTEKAKGSTTGDERKYPSLQKSVGSINVGDGEQKVALPQQPHVSDPLENRESLSRVASMDDIGTSRKLKRHLF